MNQPDPGSLDVFPNRFAQADFHSVEYEILVGDEKNQADSRMDNFNWIAAYLCEEAGVSEEGLVEWFREVKPGLADRSPINVWGDTDGYWRVFEYARAYKHLRDEALNGEPPIDPSWINRSHQLAQYALPIISDAFKSAKVLLTPPATDADGVVRQAIHNPLADDNYIQVLWKAGIDGGLHENYKIFLPNDYPGFSYFIHQYRPTDDDDPMILQTSILGDETMDSDLDGRPPSAGRMAAFVMPLAREIRRESFIEHAT